MQNITAPHEYEDTPRPRVFLAGGITNCPEWQWKVLDMLPYDLPGTVMNPRRRDFPIGDPDAAQEQIAWEYEALWDANVFSMWFCDAPSIQPICMFELGAHLTRLKTKGDISVAIGVEPGYEREQDVRIQTSLVSNQVADNISTSLEEHVNRIVTLVNEWHRLTRRCH